MAGKKRMVDYKVENNGCFTCTSHKPDRAGYPRVQIDGKPHRLTRLVYEECFGFIDEGLQVRQTCDNRMCINPEHLELVTAQEKMSIMKAKGRSNKGEDRPTAVLTEDDVKFILKNRISSDQALADRFGVCRQHVNALRNGKFWDHVRKAN